MVLDTGSLALAHRLPVAAHGGVLATATRARDLPRHPPPAFAGRSRPYTSLSHHSLL